jgi:carboxylate-amine ligase
MIDEFIPSEPLSVGVELELQLIDSESGELVNGIKPLIEIYPESPYIKPEFIQNTVELASRVGHNVADVHQHMLLLAKNLKPHCNRLGMELCGAGTHPFDERLALFTPLPRYQELEEISGILGHMQVTFATHVHIGVPTRDEAIYLFRALKPYLPLFTALSANSPFWRGYDTGFVAYRHRILAASRNYGIPPSFESWDQFCEFLEASQRAGVLESMRDIHWDIRPRPHFGTVELRVMDAQSTIDEAMQLAALARSLAACLLDKQDKVDSTLLPHALPWWYERDNHYSASRLGLDAGYVFNRYGDVRSLRSVWEDVAEAVQPYAESLGEMAYLQRLLIRVNEKHLAYARQRACYEELGNMKSIVTALIAELDAELEQAGPGNNV